MILRKWSARARELQAEEDRLHNAAPLDVATVVKGKKILLLTEMLSSIGFPSAEELGFCLLNGFSVVGDIPALTTLALIWCQHSRR